MKRIGPVSNLAIATLWCDQLRSHGIEATVQRAYASGIAGHIPPDQALPELWVENDGDLKRARALLVELQRLPERRWVCTACDELVEGPFEQCWNCGAMRTPGAG